MNTLWRPRLLPHTWTPGTGRRNTEFTSFRNRNIKTEARYTCGHTSVWFSHCVASERVSGNIYAMLIFSYMKEIKLPANIAWVFPWPRYLTTTT